MTLCLPKRIMINELKSNKEILWCVLNSGIIWIHLLSPGWSPSLLLSAPLPFRCLTRIFTQWQRTYTVVQTFTFHISAINQHLQQSVSFSDGGSTVTQLTQSVSFKCIEGQYVCLWEAIDVHYSVCVTICLVPWVSQQHGSTFPAPSLTQWALYRIVAVWV